MDNLAANRGETAENITINAENRDGTAKKKPRGRPFEKGNRANPTGRPKPTAEQKDALTALKAMGPEVVDKIRAMLDSPKTPPAVKVKIAEMVLDRTYGKPDHRVEVKQPKAEAVLALERDLNGD